MGKFSKYFIPTLCIYAVIQVALIFFVWDTQYNLISNSWIETEGKVVETIEKYNHSTDEDYYLIRIEYKNQNNEIYQVRLNDEVSKNSYSDGDPVNIIYNSNNPNDVGLSSTRWYIFSIVFGILLLGLLFTIKPVRKRMIKILNKL